MTKEEFTIRLALFIAGAVFGVIIQFINDFKHIKRIESIYDATLDKYVEKVRYLSRQLEITAARYAEKELESVKLHCVNIDPLPRNKINWEELDFSDGSFLEKAVEEAAKLNFPNTEKGDTL